MDRLHKLRHWLTLQNIDAVVISKEVNLHYFSGFRGDDTILIISPNEAMLITDSRYLEQAKLQTKNYTIIEQTEGLLKKTVNVLEKLPYHSIGFEGKSLCYDRYTLLIKELPNISFQSVDLDILRSEKDENEVASIKKACQIADAAFDDIISYIHAGIRELDIALRLESFMREHGSEGLSFPTIVASGIRGALPHAAPTDKIIEKGDFLTMDYGAIVDGYHSDITRTICLGKACGKQRQIYEAVLEAQLLGLQTIRPNISGQEVDSIVRDKLKQKNLDKYFGHGLGHGVGLEIHESPTLSKRSTSLLASNMIVTNEPGVYLPNWGGVRIEDTVLVTKIGAISLTHASKKLIEL